MDARSAQAMTNAASAPSLQPRIAAVARCVGAAECVRCGPLPQRFDRRPREVGHRFGDAHTHRVVDQAAWKGFEVLDGVRLELGSLLLAEVKKNLLGYVDRRLFQNSGYGGMQLVRGGPAGSDGLHGTPRKVVKRLPTAIRASGVCYHERIRDQRHHVTIGTDPARHGLEERLKCCMAEAGRLAFMTQSQSYSSASLDATSETLREIDRALYDSYCDVAAPACFAGVPSIFGCYSLVFGE